MRWGASRRATSTAATNTRYTSAIAPPVRRWRCPRRRGPRAARRRSAAGRTAGRADGRRPANPRCACSAITGTGRRPAPCVDRGQLRSLRSTRRWIERNRRMAPSSARTTATDRPVPVEQQRAGRRAVGHRRPDRADRAEVGQAAQRDRRVPGCRRGDDGGDRRTATGRDDGRRGGGAAARRRHARRGATTDAATGVAMGAARDRGGGGSARGRCRRLRGCRRGVDTRSCDASPTGVTGGPAGRRQEWPSIHVLPSPAEPVAPEPVPPGAAPASWRWCRSHRRCPAPAPAAWPASPDPWSLPGRPADADGVAGPPRWIAAASEPRGASDGRGDAGGQRRGVRGPAEPEPGWCAGVPNGFSCRGCQEPWGLGTGGTDGGALLAEGDFSLSAIIRLPRVKPVTLRRGNQGKVRPIDGRMTA